MLLFANYKYVQNLSADKELHNTHHLYYRITHWKVYVRDHL